MSQIISDRTPIRFGLLLSVVTICLGVLLGACWWSASWTSSVNVKLDNILIQNAAAAQLQAKINDDLAELKAWRKLIDANGSVQLQQTAKEVELLKKEIELHKIKDEQRFPPVKQP